MKFFGATAVAAAVALGLVAAAQVKAAGASAAEVKTNTSGARTYYHLALELTRDKLIERGPMIDADLGYRFSDGGQFEVYVQPELPGVAAPGCPAVTLRMPWSNPDSAEAARKVAAKQALFRQIEALRRGEGEAVPIVVELNPYLEGTPESGLRLTQCLAFFRQAHGTYVPHDGPLIRR